MEKKEKIEKLIKQYNLENENMFEALEIFMKNYKNNNSNNRKPQNILKSEKNIDDKSLQIKNKLPNLELINDYFTYLSAELAPRTKLAYLRDLKFFLEYLTENQIIKKKNITYMTLSDFKKINSKIVNNFLINYCKNYTKIINDKEYIVSNSYRSIARKTASLKFFFKFLKKQNYVNTDISENFYKIRIPKRTEDSIKKLDKTDLSKLINIVNTGNGLTKSEKKYYAKTKYRDILIITLFSMTGIRITELQQLNISSFNITKMEFKIFRKGDKESTMPINTEILQAFQNYIEFERNSMKTQDKDALFLSMQGNRISQKSIFNLVKKYTSIVMNTTRNNGYSPHKLRASFASVLIEDGYSIYEVQNLLDHENVTTTEIYAAHKKNAKKDIINQFKL